MPTYDYECDACGHEFELYQRISEEPITKCPECKKKKLRRLFGTGAAVMFKGSGFYQTDYRSESYKKGADSAKAESADTTAKKESNSGSDSSSKTEKADKPAASTPSTGEKKSSNSKRGKK